MGIMLGSNYSIKGHELVFAATNNDIFEFESIILGAIVRRKTSWYMWSTAVCAGRYIAICK